MTTLTDLFGQPELFAMLPSYPQIAPEDEEILNTLLMLRPAYWDRVWYSARVGKHQVKIPDGCAAWEKKYLEATFARRVDLLGLKGTDLHVVEIKPAASYTALGQVLVYTHLVRQLLPLPVTVIPHVLTDSADPLILPIASKHGILVTQLKDLFDPE